MAGNSSNDAWPSVPEIDERNDQQDEPNDVFVARKQSMSYLLVVLAPKSEVIVELAEEGGVVSHYIRLPLWRAS